MQDPQDTVNREVYFTDGVYRHYLSKQLTPPEVACLLKYQVHIARKNVLDIGVGAGRTTLYLSALARRYEGLDYSPVMVEFMRKTCPGVQVALGDFRSLPYPDQAFDFIFATDNVIDALSHFDRITAMAEASRVLRPGGIFAFSSHNVKFEGAFSGPRLEWQRNPVTLAVNLARYARRLKNHRRVGRLRRKVRDYALLNDVGHDYACLHYYASRETVSAQLRLSGLRLLEAFDSRGEVAPAGADCPHAPSLLYVARRAPFKTAKPPAVRDRAAAREVLAVRKLSDWEPDGRCG